MIVLVITQQLEQNLGIRLAHTITAEIRFTVVIMAVMKTGVTTPRSPLHITKVTTLTINKTLATSQVTSQAMVTQEIKMVMIMNMVTREAKMAVVASNIVAMVNDVGVLATSIW